MSGRSKESRSINGREDVNTTDTPITYLAKVEALIAKAQSTEFPAEAETFMVKAQQLMAKHAIDQAMLDAARTEKEDRIVSRTITCEAPYWSGKSALLCWIAAANDCTAFYVSGRRCHIVTVAGFQSDVEAVETLYAALSVHATSEMLKDAPPPGVNARTFRTSFLIGFAARIQVRLKEARVTAAAEAQTTSTSSVALVLADRHDQVRAYVKDRHGPIRWGAVSTTSRDGHLAGARAADRADLNQRRVNAGAKALGQ